MINPIEFDLDDATASSIFDNGSYAVDVMLYPDGSFVEYQAFKWKSPRQWEDKGRWIMIAAGDPEDWPSTIPETAIEAVKDYERRQHWGTCH